MRFPVSGATSWRILLVVVAAVLGSTTALALCLQASLPAAAALEVGARSPQLIFLLTIIALLVGGALARASVEPIRQVIRAARRMAEGDLEQRIHVDASDEIGDLGRAFNELADRLKVMVADVSADRNTLAAVLTSMDDGIVIVGSDGLVALANPAAERILQAPERQAEGRSFVEVLRDHELTQFVRDCLAGVAASAVRFLEAGLPRRYLRVHVSLLGEGRCLVVLQDLTEMRRTDTIRRDFIANVSHELRTPLASLKALVETLQDGALEDPPAAREFLERMNVEVDGMTQLVRELLELSRIESGRVALRFQEVEVGALLSQSAERLRSQADRAGIELVVDAAQDLPKLPVDVDRIQQALINLIHNAIKFTPAGGTIQVLGYGARARLDGSFELLPWEAGPVPTHVVLTVADTGVGIAAEDQQRIFERFYKADKARSGGGTGLGLAIAKHVAEAHGGRIWVESVEGRGATFRIALPLARSAAERQRGRDAAPAGNLRHLD